MSDASVRALADSQETMPGGERELVHDVRNLDRDIERMAGIVGEGPKASKFDQGLDPGFLHDIRISHLEDMRMSRLLLQEALNLLVDNGFLPSQGVGRVSA